MAGLIFLIFLTISLQGYRIPARADNSISDHSSQTEPTASHVIPVPLDHLHLEHHTWVAAPSPKQTSSIGIIFTSTQHNSQVTQDKVVLTSTTLVNMMWKTYPTTGLATGGLPNKLTIETGPETTTASRLARSESSLCPSAMPNCIWTTMTTYFPRPTSPPNHTTRGACLSSAISGSIITSGQTTSIATSNYPCSTSTPLIRFTYGESRSTCSGMQTLQPLSCPTMIPIDSACNVMWFGNITDVCIWVDYEATGQAGVGPEDIKRINQTYCQNMPVPPEPSWAVPSAA